MGTMPVVILIVLALLAAPDSALSQQMQPFEMDWRADEGTVLSDVSFLIDAPAGKDGFVRVQDGRLVTGAGRRLRIWGVNFSFVASLPPKEHAPRVAAHLARFGVNCVRVHHLDWRTPRGIIDSKHPDSRHLDAEMLDRLDFLIAELKKKGIYTDLNLNVARAFQEADGVKDAGQLGFAKALTLFDPRMIELQEEYARHLLTHRNPYTGNAYVDEPAIAIVELVNENSLIESWVRGRLLGKGPAPGAADATWTDITASYEKDLTALYQTWLAGSLSPEKLAALRKEAAAGADGAVPRLSPQEFKGASDSRFRAEASFYVSLESAFYARMGRFLKDELKVKAPVVGTSVHNGGLSPYPILLSTSQLDIIDAHTYWQHPGYVIDPKTGKRGFTIRNTAMVNEPAKSTVVTLNRSAMSGKPFIVSEVNHPYPSEFAAEMIPILASYASFQDWDGIFWYSFEHSDAANWVPKYPGHFDIRQDPVKMSQLALGALVFLRGDVAKAKQWVSRSYSRDQILDSLQLPSAEAPNFTPGMPAGLALQNGARIEALSGKETGKFPRVREPFVSDTKELTWALKDGKGVVTINTPLTQGLVGYMKTAKSNPSQLSAEVSNDFTAIMLSSLDGKPIRESERLLLTTGARTGNTGMKWDEKRTTLLETGGPPVLIEPVKGTLAVTDLERASRLEIAPLDGAGRALGPFVTAQKTLTGFRLPLGEYATPWYLIRIFR